VTENTGKKTSGVDKITWETPEKKMAAAHSLKSRDYQPLPLKRVNTAIFKCLWQWSK